MCSSLKSRRSVEDYIAFFAGLTTLILLITLSTAAFK